MNRPGVCFVVAAPETAAAFLAPHFEKLKPTFEIYLVANYSGEWPTNFGEVRCKAVRIERKVAPVFDILALFKLWNFFRKNKFQVVVSVTPKAGLLTMLAARFAGVPHRIHWFTGQVWSTRRGLGRYLLKSLDRVVTRCSTLNLADSPSQARFLTDERVASQDELMVLGDGSICGVDLDRFKERDEDRELWRRKLGIEPNRCAVLFLGRVTREKGIYDLVDAVCQMRHKDSIFLLLCGSDEEGLITSLTMQLKDNWVSHLYLGFISEPEIAMSASDLLCLPSYREGFGLTVIEAAAVGIPCVASNIYGLSDAVEDGYTGILFPAKSVQDLSDALDLLVAEKVLRMQLGGQAKIRTHNLFPQGRLTGEFEKLLMGLCEIDRPDLFDAIDR